MRIVIDLQSCQSGSSLGGIGRYSLELAKAMVTGAPGDEFIIVLNNRNEAGASQIRQEFRNLLPQTAIRLFDIPAGCSYLHGDPLAVAAAGAMRESFIESLAPDAVHLTSHFEGLGDEVVTSIPKSGPPVAVTLYDLIPYVQQKTYLTGKTAKDHYLAKFNQLQNAAAFLAISQFSASEGRQHVKNAPQLIVNIRGGVDEKFQRVADPANLDEVLARLGTGQKFLLYTASFDQRKNHERLVKAFAAVPAAIRRGTRLVMVGNGWPGIYADLKRTGASLGVPESDIVFTGRIADADLVALYNRAFLFVFPPLWEGLGLPPLEAMACGAPAIGSNTTSIPEVIGWKAAMFDPTDIAAISRLITKALTDAAYLQDLKDHAARHHPKFTWEASAALALGAIRQMVRQTCNPVRLNGTSRPALQAGHDGPGHLAAAIAAFPAPSKERLAEFAYCLAANELEANHTLPGVPASKQGWITSWATRCGIASYSKNLIDHLTGEVHVFAPHAAGASAANVSRCWEAGGNDDLSALRKRLNETQLTDVVIQFNYGFFNFHHLSNLIMEQVQKGRRVYITLHSTIDPPADIIKFRLAGLASALTAASAVFVHSENDVGRLASLGITGNVVQIAQGVRLFDAPGPARQAATRRTRIASYGFFLPGKGLLELIEAFAILRKTRPDAELYMVNANYGDAGGVSAGCIAEAKRRVRDLGLERDVTMVTGYLDDADSIAHLRSASLIVYPYQRTGESSSAAVRMGLASGRPVAVTPLPIFDDVRHATHTLPATSPDQMAAGILAALGLQAAKAPQAARINAAAAAWCASNDVRHVARYFERIVAHRSATQAWEVFAEPDLASLPRGNANFEGGRIVSAGAPALVMHGPYIDLPAGLYRVVVNGTANGPADAPAGSLKLTAQCGNVELAAATIPSGEGTLTDTIFALPNPVSEFEVTPQVEAHCELAISGYQILRRRFR